MQKSVLHIHDKQVKKVAHMLVTDFCLEAVKDLHLFKKKPQVPIHYTEQINRKSKNLERFNLSLETLHLYVLFKSISIKSRHIG